MDISTLEKLIEFAKDADKEFQKLDNAGVNIHYIEKIADKMYNIILSDFGIPKDTTAGIDFMNDDIPEDYFCRDLYQNWIFEYIEGKTTIEKLFFNLNNWESLSKE